VTAPATWPEITGPSAPTPYEIRRIAERLGPAGDYLLTPGEIEARQLEAAKIKGDRAATSARLTQNKGSAGATLDAPPDGKGSAGATPSGSAGATRTIKGTINKKERGQEDAKAEDMTGSACAETGDREAFLAFCEIFPGRPGGQTGKAAESAWGAALAEGSSRAELMAAAEAYAQEVRAEKVAPKFVLSVARWLRDGFHYHFGARVAAEGQRAPVSLSGARQINLNNWLASGSRGLITQDWNTPALVASAVRAGLATRAEMADEGWDVSGVPNTIQ
jgi:hypothetical protein